jgi:group I intron endonuclease
MKEKMYTVYIHRSPSNKAYIGITCKKPTSRWDNGNGYKKQPYFWNAIKKYGWDNFEHIILMDHLTKVEACQAERLLIALFDTMNKDYGYNIQSGGETGNDGVPMSDETKRKLSEAKKGKRPSDETRERQSKAQRERWTDEDRLKLSEKTSGENNPMFGVHRYGEQNPMYGKRHSEESKQKMSRTKIISPSESKKSVICLDTQIIYNSIADAERRTNICKANIAACCRHEKSRKTAGGYRWMFYSEYLEQQEVAA